jgi:hypothetical protein
MTDEMVKIPDQIIVSEPEEDLISIAEQRLVRFEKMMEMALKVTAPSDWVLMQTKNGPKPYLCGTGAEAIARLFGISIKDTRTEKINSQDDGGAFYFYRVTGTATRKNDVFEAMGTCSSRDSFFAMRAGEALPLSQIDETNIMKAAYTNMTTNAITRFLGIRNVTIEALEAAGIKIGEIAKVEFKSGTKGGDKSAEWNEAQKKKADAIDKALLEIYGGDGSLAGAKLEELTAFTYQGKPVPGQKDVKKLTGKRIEIAFNKVKAMYENYQKEGNGEQKATPDQGAKTDGPPSDGYDELFRDGPGPDNSGPNPKAHQG